MSTLHRLLSVTAVAVLAAALAGCAGGSSAAPSASADLAIPAVAGTCEGEADGVTVIIDASTLGEADEVSASWCVPAEEPLIAADALDLARIPTEGTEEYGDQVVCRVDGVPSADLVLTAEDGSDYREECQAMPAAFAYWAVWVKPAGGQWDYAQEGLSTLQLAPGDAVELLFTLNGEPASP